jgi:hypothetical protein
VAEQSERDVVQAQLDALWPNGQPVTLAMLEVELQVDPQQIDVSAHDPIPLYLQIELRALPGGEQEYRARVRVSDADWQPWQPAQPAIGAQALLDL